MNTPSSSIKRSSWLSAALFALIVSSAAAILPLTVSGPWLFESLLVPLAVLLSTAALRYFTTRPHATIPVALLVGCLGLTLQFASSTAILGVIPTPSTFPQLIELGNFGIASVIQQSLPATVNPGVLFLLTAWSTGCAVLCDILTFQLRAAAATGLIPMVTVIFTNAVGGRIPLEASVLAFICYALVLFTSHHVAVRHTQDSYAIATGQPVPKRDLSGTLFSLIASIAVIALALPLALGLAQAVPGTNSSAFRLDPRLNPFVNQQSLLVTLTEDLRRPEAVEAYTYRTDTAGGLYVKLANLSDFTGRDWAPDQISDELATDTPPAGVPGAQSWAMNYLQNDSEAQFNAEITLNQLQSIWLPTPYVTHEITGVDIPMQWDPQTQTAMLAEPLPQDTNYAVKGLDVRSLRPLIQQSQATTPSDPTALTALELPDDVPESVRTAAQPFQQLKDQGNLLGAATAMESFFARGDFTYSEESLVEEGYTGSSVGALDSFLQYKSGYCVHFASAMAVMAREIGIPARIATGYLPGAYDAGTSSYLVTSHDLHVWPELYFEGVGWVPFEPTPADGLASGPAGQTPTAETSQPGANTSDAPETNTPTPETNTPENSPPPSPSENESNSALSPPTNSGSSFPAAPLLLIVPLVVAALAPAGYRQWQRRRRYDPESTSPELLWKEVRSTALDYGASLSSSETVQQQAETIGTAFDLAPVPRVLVSAYERSVYGDPQHSQIPREEIQGLVAATREYCTAVSGSSSPGKRAWVWLVPRSLFASRPK